MAIEYLSLSGVRHLWSKIKAELTAKANASDLATVATSGNYSDLSGTPTIPSAVTESTVSGWGFTKNTGSYTKPSSGIPESDLVEAVRQAIALARTALQEHQSLSAYRTSAAQDLIDAGKQPLINDLAAIRAGASSGASAYQMPTDGIPESDLVAAVRSAIALARTALQEHQSLDGYATEQYVDDALALIEALIPEQATTGNQLADRAFVNSTVQTGTANFRGNWDTWADVPSNSASYPVDYTGARTPSTNDYMVVTDVSDYAAQTLTGTWRFKYGGAWATDGKAGWNPEYQVNREPLTAAQIAALNSEVTAEKRSGYDSHVTNAGIHVTSQQKDAWNAKQDAISDLSDIRSGASAGATALQPGGDVSALTNDAGYLTLDTLPIYSGEVV